MVTRPAPGPAAGITVHAIGDTHAGPTGMLPWRMDTLVRDAHLARMPAPAAVVQLGDCTNDTPVADTPYYTHFMSRFAAPHYSVMGNHDVFAQTPAQWAASLGYASPSYTVDLPGLRLVMWGTPDAWANYDVVSPDNLAWLDGAIGGTTKPVFVASHIPLYNTVGAADPALDYHSKLTQFFIKTAANPSSSVDVLDVLAAHANMKAWLCGHTHSRLDAPGLVMPVEHAGHRFASVNASTPHAVTTYFPGDAGNTIATAYVTWLGDRVEVRYRDHGAGQWASPNGKQLFTVDGLG